MIKSEGARVGVGWTPSWCNKAHMLAVAYRAAKDLKNTSRNRRTEFACLDDLRIFCGLKRFPLHSVCFHEREAIFNRSSQGGRSCACMLETGLLPRKKCSTQ